MATIAQMFAAVHSKQPPRVSDFMYLDPAVRASNERKAMMARLDALAGKQRD